METLYNLLQFIIITIIIIIIIIIVIIIVIICSFKIQLPFLAIHRIHRRPI